MENIFSTQSFQTIEKKVEKLPDVDTNQIMEDVEFYFEIENISKWALENKFLKVALQFPDDLLNFSIKVCSKLKKRCPNVTFFILADTSYGSCCVDTVAAEHYNADSLVHFGHSCLSLVDKLPVLWVFNKLPLDLEFVKSKIDEINKQIEKVIILYDVSYHYLYEKIVATFLDNSNIFVSQIKNSSHSVCNEDSTNQNLKLLFSRVLPIDLKNDASSYSFFYIGNNDSFLNPFLLYLNKNKFFTFNPTNRANPRVEEVLFSKTNRELMKRYYLIEKAKDAKIFGILIGTMSASKYKEAIVHVSQLLKKADRRFYSFLIGKLNCPKLNNFMEVDTYVLIACNENSLINSKELNKPIITVYELEMAFNCARLWGEEYVTDYRQLLSGNEHYVPVKISDQESDVSLITGVTRNLKNAEIAEEDKVSTLINREKVLSVANYSPAGDFLKNRSWTGLEQNLGNVEVTKAIEGKKGIAAGYEDEIK